MGIFNRHKHKWNIVSRKFYPSYYEVTNIRGQMSFDMKCVVFGYTYLSLLCEECGEVGHRRELGEWNDDRS